MTKKDFELIAATLRQLHTPESPSASEYIRGYADACTAHARVLADALATTNPEFDRARFLAACGVQS